MSLLSPGISSNLGTPTIQPLSMLPSEGLLEVRWGLGNSGFLESESNIFLSMLYVGQR